MNNKYSIVSFVKNEGQFYLKAMLHSIVDYADEIIMVDNGSVDNTVPIIKSFPKVQLLEIETSPEDIAVAINAAIAKVTTDWIFIMAGDEVFLPQHIGNVRGMIDEMIELNKRIGVIQYLDFIGDYQHYHTKYVCWASRIWKNECDFKYYGDWQGELYMGYNDGIHTGGISTKKNLLEEQLHKRADIKFFHYARCKPQPILKQKRKRYWSRRVAPELVKEKLNSDPFYTLNFGDKLAYYDGDIPAFVESKVLSKREKKNMSYIEYLRNDYPNAIKEWRKRWKELSDEEWIEGVDISMSFSGKKPWSRECDVYERIILDKCAEHIERDTWRKEEMTVLDVGCGYGFLLYQFHLMGIKELCGVDISRTCLDICASRFGEKNIITYLIHSDVGGSGFEDGSFDLVTCTEVLEHDPDPLKIINDIYDKLKPGGIAYFSVPNLDRRQAWSHINIFHLGDLPKNIQDGLQGDIHEYHKVIEINYKFEESYFNDYKIWTDDKEKFLIVEAVK